jgi:hypothetical protein
MLKEMPNMTAKRFLAVTVVFLSYAIAPVAGQVCTQAKYANTIACLPTNVANANVSNSIVYFQGGQNHGAVQYSIVENSNVGVAVPLQLGAQYASQVATSPSAATSAGYVFTFENGALSTKPADMGPVFSDLPQTIGRNKLYVGSSYQWTQFSKIGGKSMANLPFYTAFVDPKGQVLGYWLNEANASIKIHSVDTFLSYGITDNLEVSVVVPWNRVSMSFGTSCDATSQTTYLSSTAAWGPDGKGGCYSYNPSDAFQVSGLPSGIPSSPWFDEFFFDPSSGSKKGEGLGDVTLRAKYEFLKKNQQGVALGLEYRLPTGDPLNMHGSGATGARAFLAWSYNGRVSPHTNLGFQYNGSSVNDVSDKAAWSNSANSFVFTNQLKSTKLPNTFTGSVGADFALTMHFNLNADLLMRVFSNDGTKGFTQQQSSLFGSSPYPNLYSGVNAKSTVVLGEKWKLSNHFLLSTSLMIDASNNGLSYRPSPIATLSYDFGGKSNK